MTDEAAWATLLAAGLHQCRVAVGGDGSLAASLFLTGLVGGASHCAGMCGPFVLSQVAARLERRPVAEMREWHRLAGAAALPYHLGRATTYAGLGAAAALVTGALTGGTGVKWAGAALLLLAAAVLAVNAVPGLKAILGGAGAGRDSAWARAVSRLAGPLFARPTGWRGYGLGVALGFIPCGLLYGALAAAAATGQALGGALGMAAFAAGTVPSLLAVGLVGHMATRWWKDTIFRYAPLLLLVNAGVLTWMAWRLVA